MLEFEDEDPRRQAVDPLDAEHQGEGSAAEGRIRQGGMLSDLRDRVGDRALQRRIQRRAAGRITVQRSPAHEAHEGGKAAAPRQDSNVPVRPGHELWVKCSLGPVTYHHAGIYIGNGEVVSVNGYPRQAANDALHGRPIVHVLRESVSKFMGSHTPLSPGPTKNAFPEDKVIERAVSHVGESWNYNVLTHNCQHFASDMASGVARSPEASAFEHAATAPFTEAGEHVTELGHKMAGALEHTGHKAEHAAESVGHKAEHAAGSALKKVKHLFG